MARPTQQKTQQVATVQDGGPLQLPQEQRHFLQTIKLALTQQMPILERLLPKQENKDRFIANIMTAIVNGKDGKLFQCTPQSILNAAREAVEFGLSLNPQRKQADLIPRWNSKASCLEAQFQIRYGGLMTLATRSGEVRSISSTAVREGEHFVYERGLNPVLQHTPSINSRKPVIAAYCIWTLKDGTKEFEVIDQEDIDRAMRASQSKNKEGEPFGPWKDDYEEQVRKTAVRRASKYMPSSAEDFQKAVQMDTLRDIGHEVVMDGGEIIDVTEAAPAAPTNAPAAAKQQLDKLEGKVAPKPQPAPQPAPQTPPQAAAATPPVTMTPMIRHEDGSPDYASWATICVPIVHGKSPEFKAAWRVAHDVMIEGGEMQAPDAMEALMRALA